LARNAFHLVLGQIGTSALSLVLSAALGRSLGAADFGLLYLVTTMATFAYVLAEWGQAIYLVGEVARHPDRAGTLLGSSLAFRVIGAGVVGALGLVVAWGLGYDGRTLGLYALLVTAYVPLFCARTFGFVFRGHERMDYDALASVLTKALTLLLTIPALALGGRLVAVILAQGGAGVGALAASAWLFSRLRLSRPRATREGLRELAAGGAPFLAMSAAISLQPYLDAIVLSKLAPTTVVGWYGSAQTFMNALVMPAAILTAAAYPGLSKAAGDPEAFRKRLRSTLRPVLVLGTLTAVGTFLFADLMVNLVYGTKKFGPAVAVLQVFAPVLFIAFIDMMLGSAIMAAGKARPLAIAKLVAVGLTTGLELLLVPWFQDRFGNGAIGLVVGFGAAEFVVLAASVTLLRPGTLDRKLLLDLGRALVAGAGTLALVMVLPASPLVALPACLLGFTLLSVLLGLVNRDDVASFRALVERR
jgi:O-antigen/teichoic acid export membrane protein